LSSGVAASPFLPALVTFTSLAREYSLASPYSAGWPFPPFFVCLAAVTLEPSIFLILAMNSSAETRVPAMTSTKAAQASFRNMRCSCGRPQQNVRVTPTQGRDNGHLTIRKRDVVPPQHPPSLGRSKGEGLRRPREALVGRCFGSASRDVPTTAS